MKILYILGAAVSLLHAEVPSAIAIRNARIVTVSGPVIAKGTVLIRNGFIAGVGENLTPPPYAWIVEAQGLTVYPGLIDALSTWGIPPATPAVVVTTGRTSSAAPATGRRSSGASADPVVHGPEERPNTNSWVRAADMVAADDSRILSGRNAGFTAAMTFPTMGIFGGQGALINLSGDKRRMVMATPIGQYVSLATAGSFSSYPGSLMGVIAYVRQVYLDAAHYQIERAAYEKDRMARRPAYDRAVEGLLESSRTLLPAGSAVQLERMARFAQELKLNAVLYGGHEAYADAAKLRQFGYPVLVSLKWPSRSRDADPELRDSLRTLTLREQAPGAPAALAKAGVKYAFFSDGISPREVTRAVKRSIDAGLAPADAIRALTLGVAEIYGFADRLGSVEKGKIANLVVTSGDLFQERTEVKYIFIEGVKYAPMPEPPVTERSGSSGASGGESPSPDNPPDFGGVR